MVNEPGSAGCCCYTIRHVQAKLNNICSVQHQADTVAWGRASSSTSSMEKTDLEVPSFSHTRSGSFLATRALIVHESSYGFSAVIGFTDLRRFPLGAPVVLGGLPLASGGSGKD